MNAETTASKVNRLLQKSRQAFRIYSSMSKSAKAEHNEFADMQAIEWRNINAELVRQLTHIVDKFAAKSLALQIARMRDSLLADYRRVEAELNAEHREIIACAQRADFIRVAQLSRILISKKAFVQAAQAASHELSLIIDDKPAHLSEHASSQNVAKQHSSKLSISHLGKDQSLGVDDLPIAPVSTQTCVSSGSQERELIEGSQFDNVKFSNTGKLLKTSSESSGAQDILSKSEQESDDLLFPRMAKVIPLRR